MFEKGLNYLIYEEKTNKTYKLIGKIISDGTPAICLTTTFPEKVKKAIENESIKIYWLTEKSGDVDVLAEILHPRRLEFEVMKTLSSFIKSNKGAIFFLDGLEYLILENGFESVRKFLKKIQDMIAMYNGTFIVPVNPEAFSKENLNTLAKGFDKIEDIKNLIQEEKKNVCSKCGAAWEENVVICGFCGTRIGKEIKSVVKSEIKTIESEPVTIEKIELKKELKPEQIESIEIEDIYLIHRGTGALIQRRTWRKSDLIDPDLVAGMFESIKNFISESFVKGKVASFSRMDIKDFTILVMDGQFVSVALVLSGAIDKMLHLKIEKLKAAMLDVVKNTESKFQDILQDWDGNIDALKGTRKNLDMFASKVNDIIEGVSEEPKAEQPSQVVQPIVSPVAPTSTYITPPQVTEKGLSIEELMRQAVQFEKNNRHEDALACYEKVLTADPSNLRALFNKAALLQILGRVTEAINGYNQLLTVNPNDYEAWSNLGIALRSQGRTLEAIECYNRALTLNPRDVSTISNKGVALRSIGRIDEALQCYEAALKINPGDAGVWANKGIALQNIGKFYEAIQSYNRALVIKPTHKSALRNREIAIAELKRTNPEIDAGKIPPAELPAIERAPCVIPAVPAASTTTLPKTTTPVTPSQPPQKSVQSEMPTTKTTKEFEEFLQKIKSFEKTNQKFDRAESFIIIEKEPDKTFNIAKQLSINKALGLCISREVPSKITDKYNIENITCYWLSRVEAPNSIPPTNIEGILMLINEFLGQHENDDTYVILDGLDYLIIQNNFNTIVKLIHELRDTIIMKKSRLFIPVDADKLSEKDFTVIKRDMKIVE